VPSTARGFGVLATGRAYVDQLGALKRSKGPSPGNDSLVEGPLMCCCGVQFLDERCPLSAFAASATGLIAVAFAASAAEMHKAPRLGSGNQTEGLAPTAPWKPDER
jgi:hypothetical protein